MIATFILTREGKNLDPVNLVFGVVTPLLWNLSLLEGFRKRSRFLTICFNSFNRPEDYPFTLLWVTTGLIAGYFVLLGMVEWLKVYEASSLILITVFISVFGDGLAEPIGVRYGRHKYETYALFTKKRYVRSIEGSACVALSAISIVIAMYSYMSPYQFIFMLVAMPVVMTIVEAKSPHTWDNPFLHLVGGVVTIIGCHYF